MEKQINYYSAKLAYEMDPSDLYTSLEEGQEIIVIDARKPSGFEAEHIPGAINIPHRDMNEETTRDLDRKLQYVTYCDGIGCNASTKGALQLAKLGFMVRELIGGIQWWKFDGYPTTGTDAEHNTVKIECAC